jgi:hypothetical protein
MGVNVVHTGHKNGAAALVARCEVPTARSASKRQHCEPARSFVPETRCRKNELHHYSMNCDGGEKANSVNLCDGSEAGFPLAKHHH